MSIITEISNECHRQISVIKIKYFWFSLFKACSMNYVINVVVVVFFSYTFYLFHCRLVTISTCSGVAGTLCIVSSYQRVPCHLQDPLKGAALVYSLVFYFFFCRKGKCCVCVVKSIGFHLITNEINIYISYRYLMNFSFIFLFVCEVMGLQRLFSATTAVVGLFISVDYGLCDEFRCRGRNITAITTSNNALLTELLPTVGWQGRAMWTLVYVGGIALWILHLSLLEGYVVTAPNVSLIQSNRIIYFSNFQIFKFSLECTCKR